MPAPRLKKLRDVLYARFLLTAVVPIVLVSVVACAYLWRQEMHDAEWKNEMLAESVANQVDVFLREPANMLSHGTSTVVRYGGLGGGRKLDPMLGILVRDSDVFDGIYLVDRSGRVVSAGLRDGTGEALEELRGIDLSGDDFLMEVVRSGKPGWSDSWRPPAGGKTSLALCVPLEGGALFGSIDIAHLGRLAKRAGKSGIGVAILDRRGTVISHSDNALVGRSVTLRNIPLVTSGLSGDEATGEYLLDGTRYLGSVARVERTRWIVLVSQPVSDAVAAVWKLFAIFIGGGLLAVSIAVGLSRRQAGSISRHFTDLTEQAERIGGGQYGGSMATSPYVEVRRLADGFRRMASAVEDRERRLQESRDRYQILFDGAIDAILVFRIDADGRVGNFIEVNDAACRMIGRTREELAGMSLLDVIPPESREGMAERAKELLGEGFFGREETIVSADGRRVPVECFSKMFPLEGTPAVFSVVRDLTERKRAEREKEELEAKLRQSQKLEAVGTLAGGIAHDFNNLLQVISGYTALALKEVQTEGSLRDNLVQVRDSAGRAAELVSRLLAFSRKESPRKRMFRLAAEVEGAVRLLEFTIPKMIAIRTRIEPDLADVDGDPTQIGQVVVNLCTNARDAMPDGGLLSIEAENVEFPPADPALPPDRAPGRYVSIRVSDSGTGMDESTRMRIFDPFFTTKEVGKGTGLGLSIVYGIVQSHGGWVTCESEPGRGTSFTVFLPASGENGEAREAGEEAVAAAQEAEGHGRGRRVLVADDDRAVRTLAVSILEMQGYTVESAASGEEALDLFRAGNRPPDLVVLDLGMPGMGGARCLEEIRKESSSVRVIVASGYIPEAKALEIRNLGATIVAKPYGVAGFEATVRRVMES